MIGPILKQEKQFSLVCSECEVVISRELGGTKLYPKIRIVNYCSHKDLDNSIKNPVAFIKRFPHTPIWCPANGK